MQRVCCAVHLVEAVDKKHALVEIDIGEQIARVRERERSLTGLDQRHSAGERGIDRQCSCSGGEEDVVATAAGRDVRDAADAVVAIAGRQDGPGSDLHGTGGAGQGGVGGSGQNEGIDSRRRGGDRGGSGEADVVRQRAGNRVVIGDVARDEIERGEAGGTVHVGHETIAQSSVGRMAHQVGNNADCGSRRCTAANLGGFQRRLPTGIEADECSGTGPGAAEGITPDERGRMVAASIKGVRDQIGHGVATRQTNVTGNHILPGSEDDRSDVILARSGRSGVAVGDDQTIGSRRVVQRDDGGVAQPVLIAVLILLGSELPAVERVAGRLKQIPLRTDDENAPTIDDHGPGHGAVA